jgi:preprotein translocase subunit SecD
MKAIIFIVFVLLGKQTYSQTRNLDSIKWTQIEDTSSHNIKAGFYLCMPLPVEYMKAGFRFNDKAYFIAEKEFLSLKNIDTIYKRYDANFKSNILNIKFNKEGADQLLKYTMKWQGFSVGLFIKNKFLSVGLLDGPIGEGLMSITGDFSFEQINAVRNAIKK